MAAIPTVQKAALIKSPGPNATIQIHDDVPVESPGPHQILVQLTHTGLCGSEVRAFLGWNNYKPIIGHEGVGTVVKLGPEVDAGLLHARVGVKWVFSACGACPACQSNEANHCAKQINSGLQVPGTLQQFMVADARYVTKIPDGLASELAAPLLCAGVTMAGAVEKLDRHSLPPDAWVVVQGAGGGLGHIGVQIATRLRKYRVIAVDSGATKKALSLESGAEHFVDFETEDVESRVKELTGGYGAHACVIVAGSQAAFEAAPKLVKNTGLLVAVGLPKATYTIPLSVSACSARALTVAGVSVGSEGQMVELLDYAAKGVIVPTVEVRPFSEISELFAQLQSEKVTGRLVVKLDD